MIRTMLLAFSLLAAGGLSGAQAATCYGHEVCRACKNCRYCKYCAKDGVTCGVCRRGAAARPRGSWEKASQSRPRRHTLGTKRCRDSVARGLLKGIMASTEEVKP